jgi:hypothetical protein
LDTFGNVLKNENLAVLEAEIVDAKEFLSIIMNKKNKGGRLL